MKTKKSTRLGRMGLLALLTVSLVLAFFSGQDGLVYAQQEEPPAGEEPETEPELTHEPFDELPIAPLPGKEELTVSAITVPSPLSPSGTIYTTKPTYQWALVTNATKYQIQVYKGTVKILDITRTSTSCSSTTCSTTPGTILAFTSAYKWRVRAYVNDAWKTWTAYKFFNVASNLSKTVSPSGFIAFTKPTYKWTRAANAAKYQIQVYKGSTKVLDIIRWSSTCSGSTCSTTPSRILTVGNHQWRVRSYVNDAWTAWSPYRSFSVGFNSTFNGSYTGWSSNPGAAWRLYNNTYYGTGGVENKFSTTRFTKAYTNFDYQVRVKRIGGDDAYNAVCVRMGFSFNPDNNGWYPGYCFGYYDDGWVYILEITASDVPIQILDVISSAVVPYGWNTLRVVANGSHFKYYINGTLIHEFDDSSCSSGYVGLMMQKFYGSGSTTFYADWAKLTPLD